MAKKGTTRYYSNLQEQEVAELLGMEQQINSGATLFEKGDIYDEYSLLDAKTVTKEQTGMRIEESWFKKLKKEAFSMGKDVIGIVFRFSPRGEDYVAVPIEQYKEMYDCYKENILENR